MEKHKIQFQTYIIIIPFRGEILKTFPPPLTAEEEYCFLRKYADGDLDAKRILIEHNLRLVTHIIKKYQYLDEDPEDLISIGTIGLIKAVTTFDTNKNTRFATYACRCIENEILMLLRSRKKTNRECSLYEPIGTDCEGNEIQLYDVIESDDVDAFTKVFTNECISILEGLIKTILTEREQYVLIKRYGLFDEAEQTQNEIASFLGISRSYVSRIEKGAILKLRPYF